jgi:hypothetical protein
MAWAGHGDSTRQRRRLMERRSVRVETEAVRGTIAVLVGLVLLGVALLTVTTALAEPRVAVPDASGIVALEAEVGYDPSLLPRVPRKFNYQGVLRDSEGNLMDGEHDLTFTIYRSVTETGLFGVVYMAWDAVYSETQTVDVTGGLLNVQIGRIDPLHPSDFAGIEKVLHRPLEPLGQLGLGVAVDGGVEVGGKVDLLSVPYAFRSEYVNRFPDEHYDSGWEDCGHHFEDYDVYLLHNLGGTIDDYVVDLTCKDGEGYVVQCDQDYARWEDLTNSSITIWVAGVAQLSECRLRIWRID